MGVSFLEHSRPWAWAGDKVPGLCGLCVGEDTFSNHREGVTSVVQGLAGRGRVFVWPGGARLSALPPLRWERLVAATMSEARCLYPLGGSGLFWEAGLGRRVSVLQTVQEPHPSSWSVSLESESAGFHGQGGAGQGGASPHPFPCSATRAGHGGGDFQSPPGYRPLTVYSPLGHAREAQDLFRTKALDLESPAVLHSSKDFLIIGLVRPTKWKLHVVPLKDLDLFCLLSCSHFFICIIFCTAF